MSGLSMLSFKSSVRISAARLRSGTACAVLELDGVAGVIPAGAVLELASPVSSASVGSDGARFLVGCASRIGSPVSGFTCADNIFGEGDVISASVWSLSPPLSFFSFRSCACAKHSLLLSCARSTRFLPASDCMSRGSMRRLHVSLWRASCWRPLAMMLHPGQPVVKPWSEKSLLSSGCRRGTLAAVSCHAKKAAVVVH